MSEEENEEDSSNASGADHITQQEQEEQPIVDIDEDTELDSEEDLHELVQQQQKRIETLQSQLLDLSTRVADGGGVGVCSVDGCKGPVVKVNRWLRPTTIECRRCDEVFYEY